MGLEGKASLSASDGRATMAMECLMSGLKIVFLMAKE